MHPHNHFDYSEPLFQLLMALPPVLFFFFYLAAVIRSNHRYKKWPWRRTGLCLLSILCAAATMVGPLANRASTNFTAHMVGHVLIGMIAPLLLVLAAPITLLLRVLKIKHARYLTRVLKSRPMHILSDPITASVLNVGGLWLIYTAGLYEAMMQNVFLHGAVHIHVFLAGYLFTASIVSIDPTPHRRTFLYRSIVLVLALASHAILSKYIYINPPGTIPKEQAETAGMIMYYAGDIVDFFLIFLLCLQWFKTARPRENTVPVLAAKK